LDDKILPVNFALRNEEAGDDQDERPTEHRDAEDPSVEESALSTCENERGTRGKGIQSRGPADCITYVSWFVAFEGQGEHEPERTQAHTVFPRVSSISNPRKTYP